MTRSTKNDSFPSNVDCFRRGWPLIIDNEKVDADSIIQSAHFLSGLFKHFEHEGKVPLQASLQLTVILRED